MRSLPAAKLCRRGQGDLMTATLRPFAAFALLKTICHDPHQSGSRWMALSLVAFLRADSNSCAVFAAATIEFIGEFDVCGWISRHHNGLRQFFAAQAHECVVYPILTGCE